MNLFFVYDTVYCKEDEDDPKDAIVYFFPVQASENHRYFLCCQLVGVAKFLKSAFSTPSIIVLDQGKFAFLWSGNYLLVLGANSDTSSNVLKDQLSFLCGIFCFYHGSINNVLKACGNNRDEFLSRMELAWSRYITLSQCFGNVLQLSMNALPLKSYKKNSHVVSTANRLLHVCQLSSSVTAGCVFHNSRVLSTQFFPQLTNYLSLLSNTNAAAPVGNAIHVLRNLPPDVELKYVYLKPKAVSSIVKYNHTSVGSRIRVKSGSRATVLQQSCSPSAREQHLSSGSEGDVDSGNCSESVHSHKDRYEPWKDSDTFGRKSKRHSSLRSQSRHKRLCTVSCCVGHSRLFEKNLLVSRNVNLSAYLDASEGRRSSEKLAGRVVSKAVRNLSGESRATSSGVAVLCHSHARLWASSFVCGCKMRHTNMSSCRDLEHRCSLCSNHPASDPALVRGPALKRWNSDVDLSGYAHRQCACELLTSKPCDGHHYYDNETVRSATESRDEEREVSKIQVLKCRTSSDTNRRLHPSRRPALSRRATIDVGVPNHNTRSQQSLSGEDDKYSSLESNVFQKHVLYVQRYGSSTLVLLLHKVFDEKVINYLWNCGFTILRELEYNAEKQEMEKSFELEPSFYLLLYNYAHKVLKEYPHFPSLLLTEKHSRKTIQQIQEDFQNDPHFKSISLLSSNQSVFACQTEHSLAFYLQPEADTRKLDPLNHLAKKASRRLAKYFKLNL